MTQKGQIVIPASIRKKYNIKPGTLVNVIEQEGKIILEPVTKDYIKKLRGIAAGSGALEELKEQRDKDRKKENEKSGF